MSLLDELIVALDAPERASSVTSLRQPDSLRRAMKIAVEMGWASSSNDGLNQALRAQLDAFAQRLALEEHYAAHPGTKPTLAEVAIALAELDHSPLADDSELLAFAAEEVRAERPEADADDVLLWAASLRKHQVKPPSASQTA